MVPEPPTQNPNAPRPDPPEPDRPASGCLGHLYALIGSLLAEILATVVAIFALIGFLLLATSKGGWVLLALGGLVVCALAILGLSRNP